VEKQCECKIKVLRTDNGGEYLSKYFDEYLKIHGIARQTSTPYTPQQNGVAERANRTIVEMARSMLHAQNLGHEFWAEAVVNAVYTRNRCPTNALSSMTPQQAWSGKKPCVSHMRTFGCIAYAKVPDCMRTKLDAKGTKCVFLGYCEGTKAYRLMCLDTKKIIKSRDVEFVEHKSACEHLEMCPSGSNGVFVDTSSISAKKEEEDEDIEELNQHEEPKKMKKKKKKVYTFDVTNNEEVEGENEDDDEEYQPLSEKRQGSKENKVGEHQGESSSNERRYPTRERKQRGEWWKDHIFPQVSEEHANVALLADPLSICDAMKSTDALKWEEAMKEEYKSLMSNGTWELTQLPPNRSSIGCKWVFRTKRDAMGDIVRYKARLVAKGYSQVAGVDFNETFAPVAKFTTIRTIVAIVEVNR
jgi:reverse transcriptase-like protein